MKLQLSALLAASTLAAAQPTWDRMTFAGKSGEVFGRANDEINSTYNFTSPMNSTFPNATFPNRTHNSSWNSTVHEETKDIFKVIITGGEFKLENSTHVEYKYCFNQTNALNLTQMYEVSEIVNNTLADEHYKGVVIVAGADSVESLGFLNSIVIDSKKPVVVAENDAYGVVVANQTESTGALVVTSQDLVYPGAFSPYSTRYASFGGVPVAACGDDLSVNFFFESYQTKFLSKNSTIRSNFSQLTNYNATKDSSVNTLVPIIAEKDLTVDLLESIASTASGLVVVATEDAADTYQSDVDYSSVSIPVVFAKSVNTYPYLSKTSIPEGTCSAGYLSPSKAQLLLTIALVNDITEKEDIVSLFP